MASATVLTPNHASQSPYRHYHIGRVLIAFGIVNFSSTTCFVRSIICRPKAVTDEEMARHGSCPTVAPRETRTRSWR